MVDVHPSSVLTFGEPEGLTSNSTGCSVMTQPSTIRFAAGPPPLFTPAL
jgi:hypothetical protein